MYLFLCLFVHLLTLLLTYLYVYSFIFEFWTFYHLLNFSWSNIPSSVINVVCLPVLNITQFFLFLISITFCIEAVQLRHFSVTVNLILFPSSLLSINTYHRRKCHSADGSDLGGIRHPPHNPSKLPYICPYILGIWRKST